MSKEPQEKKLIYNNESCISEWLFLFVNKIIDKGLASSIETNDLYELPEKMRYEEYYPHFQRYYDAMMLRNPKTSITRILAGFFKKSLIQSACLSICSCCCDVGIPLLIKQMVFWIASPNGEWWLGLIYATAISLTFLDGFCLMCLIGWLRF